MTQNERPTITMKLQPLPNINPTDALQHALKILLRHASLRCLDYSIAPPAGDEPNTASPNPIPLDN